MGQSPISAALFINEAQEELSIGTEQLALLTDLTTTHGGTTFVVIVSKVQLHCPFQHLLRQGQSTT